MATYKKRGAKKSIAVNKEAVAEVESTTAEVFETLDTTASKTEEWVVKYQNIILGLIGLVAVGVLGYLGYTNFVLKPKEQEAISELNQAQYYFELAVNTVNSDSLYNRALNGGEGKYGFLDIIENYSGTPAAKLATYSAGMSYLNLKDYKNAIVYLEKFTAEDVLLSALSKGAIGDAFAQLGQPEDAYDYYLEASKINDNLYTTPKYLYKAAVIGSDLGKTKEALAMLKRIEKEFPESSEAQLVSVQIGRLEALK
ncbi:MAG: tetratricopeptide repeat protein [Flavobacteriaceae bacterium]